MEIAHAISRYLKNELLAEQKAQWDLETNLLTTGIMDSLSIVRLIVFLEEEYNVSLDQYLELENFKSVSTIASIVERELAG